MVVMVCFDSQELRQAMGRPRQRAVANSVPFRCKLLQANAHNAPTNSVPGWRSMVKCSLVSVCSFARIVVDWWHCADFAADAGNYQ